MGGPFWARKDAGAWSIPKGEFLPPESARDAALREFAEEIGVPAPDATYVELGDFRQSSGKVITVFIAESDLHIDRVSSNTFSMEWPPRSGRMQSFPEMDDAGWFALDEARGKLTKGQQPLMNALVAAVSDPGPGKATASEQRP